MLSICISVIYRIVLIKTHVVPGTMVSTSWSVHCSIVTTFYYSSNDSNNPIKHCKSLHEKENTRLIP